LPIQKVLALPAAGGQASGRKLLTAAPQIYLENWIGATEKPKLDVPVWK